MDAATLSATVEACFDPAITQTSEYKEGEETTTVAALFGRVRFGEERAGVVADRVDAWVKVSELADPKLGYTLTIDPQGAAEVWEIAARGLAYGTWHIELTRNARPVYR